MEQSLTKPSIPTTLADCQLTSIQPDSLRSLILEGLSVDTAGLQNLISQLRQQQQLLVGHNPPETNGAEIHTLKAASLAGLRALRPNLIRISNVADNPQIIENLDQLLASISDSSVTNTNKSELAHKIKECITELSTLLDLQTKGENPATLRDLFEGTGNNGYIELRQQFNSAQKALRSVLSLL